MSEDTPPVQSLRKLGRNRVVLIFVVLLWGLLGGLLFFLRVRLEGYPTSMQVFTLLLCMVGGIYFSLLFWRGFVERSQPRPWPWPWPWRLFFLFLGAVASHALVADSARSHLIGPLLADAGLFVCAVVWFFQPFLSASPPRTSFESALRLFSTLGLLLLATGTVLQYVFNL